MRRDKYLQNLIESKWNGFPKIITGIRRCGKSYLLQNIFVEQLKKSGVAEDCILVLELDDDRNALLRDPLELGRFVREKATGKNEFYVVLDEIQRVFSIINPALTGGMHKLARKSDSEVISFVDVVLGLSHEPNIDLYVTGSNSRMLSSDIITEFRDKATHIHMGPLSFEEFYSFRGGVPSETLGEYMQFGGMPLAILSEGIEKKNYLASLFEMTYFRDIVERNGIRKSGSIDELCTLLSDYSGQLLNSEKIANTFMSVRKERIDKNTIEHYIDSFQDAFIIREARRFDIRGKKEIGALRKYYFTDTGLRNARLNFAFPDEGQLLENIVFNELIYHGYTVNVGVFDTVEKNKDGNSVRKGNKIDFIAAKVNRRFYIQVALDVSAPSVLECEIRPFLKAGDQVQKILVLNKQMEECLDRNGFTVIGITDFLLNFLRD